MKNLKIKQGVFLLTLMLFLFIQITLQAQMTEEREAVNLEETLKIDWNKPNALPYHKGFSLNRSFIAFREIEEDNTVAFLSDVNNTVMVYSKENGDLLQTIQLDFRAHHFFYSKGTFYFLADNHVVLYDKKGTYKSNIEISTPNRGFYDMTILDEEIYLLQASGTSLMLNQNNEIAQGWPLSDGSFAESILIRGQGYKIIGWDKERNFTFEKNITTQESIACAIIIGSDDHHLYVETQYIVKESPLEVVRYVDVIERKSLTNNQTIVEAKDVQRIKLPDVQYTHIKKDIIIGNAGVLHAISSPEDVRVFEIGSDVLAAKSEIIYPTKLSKLKYHYNNDLLELPK